MLRILRSLRFLALLALSAAYGANEVKPDVKYFIIEGGGPDQGPGPDMDKNLEDLKEAFGPVDPHSNRMYGYGVQQVRILTRSSAVVRADIERALDAAEETGIPVWIHLDSVYGWGADTEESPEEAPAHKFWKEEDMREWMEFPVEGKLPTFIPRIWINWGPWCSPAPAVPAFGSPKFVEFARTQLREGVLVPLKARLEKWKAEGREYLFAGINLGWETQIPEYADNWIQFNTANGQKPIIAEVPSHIAGLEMDRKLYGAQLGHASLHWRGWDEKSIVKAARREGISTERKFQNLCFEVIHDYNEALAKECSEAGLSPDKVYTHIIALSSVTDPRTNMPPISAAVNPYSTPGFTMDNKGPGKYNVDEVKRQIAAAPGSRSKNFGVVETYFTLFNKVYITDADAYEKELETTFSDGATVMSIFGALPFTSESAPDAALEGVRRWLKNGDKPSSPSSSPRQ